MADYFAAGVREEAGPVEDLRVTALELGTRDDGCPLQLVSAQLFSSITCLTSCIASGLMKKRIKTIRVMLSVLSG